MICDIFKRNKIFHYAFVDAAVCSPANRRLYGAVPPGCRAVFVLFPYYTGADPFPLARFAAVPDYHIFAGKVFGEVCEYINIKYPGVYASGFADHSPFAESSGAAAAGLGIIGKNGLLINREHSSYVCIGELVTELGENELLSEGVPRGSGRVECCEDCGACSAACPGGCAGGEARDTCVSSINQKKGELTAAEIERMQKSGYIWGCDVCQRVCPHTAAAVLAGTVETPIDFFRVGAVCSDVIGKIRSLSDEEYKKYPFAWRKRDIMERNIRIVKK